MTINPKGVLTSLNIRSGFDMDILKQFDGKINGTLETFDQLIINGYLQHLHSFRLFLYYLIPKM